MEVSETLLLDSCAARDIKVHKVESANIKDPRMQNIAVLAHIHKHNLVPLVEKSHFLQAMDDLMTGSMLDRNLELFNLPHNFYMGS